MYVCAIIVLLKLTCNVRNLMFDLHAHLFKYFGSAQCSSYGNSNYI